MDRIVFIIESTGVHLACLLNPEEKEGLTIQRTTGATREQSNSLTGSEMSEDPIVSRSRGDTSMELKLLFDVTLAGSSIRSGDVRDLTNPFWKLAGYWTKVSVANELPVARLFWGKGWEIRVTVRSITERFERFSPNGLPRRSWLTLGLMRVHDQPPLAERPSLFSPTQMPTSEQLAASSDPGWGVHEKLGEGIESETLWALADRYYGDPRLWRLIALANRIDHPFKIPAGKLLVIPPLKALKVLRWFETLTHPSSG